MKQENNVLLNGAQIEAINTKEGNLLIIASAGTGKTTTIVERYVNFVNNCNFSPDEIIMTTFTNKAAKDMIEKISKRTAKIPKYIGTMHSLFLRILRDNCEEVGIKLRRLSKKARTVGFYLTGEESYHGRKTLKNYIDSGAEIFEIFKIFYKEWDLAKKDRQEAMVRQISVWATNLEDCQNTPLSLFDFENKKNTIQNTVDSINERFGDHTIRSGFLLYADKLTTVPNGYMADRFERKRVSEKFQDLLQTK